MAQIAGLEVGLPTSVGDVDAPWMTKVLHTSGALDAGSAVASIDVQPFAVGAGLLSLLYRASLTYSGSQQGPESVIVKLPTDNETQRAIADGFLFYPREVRFYREVAPRSELRVAQAHAAMVAEDSSDFVIVMEEMDPSGAVDQRDGATWEQALQSVDAMARFHAGWHASPELADLADTFLPLDAELYKIVLPGVFDGGWPAAKEHAGDLLSEDILGFGDRWSTLMVGFMEHLNTPATFLHGDWRLDNVFYDDQGPKVIDFQITGLGNGAYDLGYFVSQSLERDVRNGRESELVQRYVDVMAECGVDCSFADVMFDFKIAVAQCFVYGVASFPSYDALPERSQDLMRVLLGRSAQAIEDLDVLSVIDEVPQPS